MDNNNAIAKSYYDMKSKVHNTFKCGTALVCQNTRNKKWDRRGLVIEGLPFRKYKIKIDGSGRVSIRNRVHLRPLLHEKPHLPSAGNADVTEIELLSDVTSLPETSGSSLIIPMLRRSERVRNAPQRYGDWVG